MKRLISLGVSLVILAVIYWRVDFTRFGPIFQHSNLLWMTLSLAMVIPLTMFTAWRLIQLMPGQVGLGTVEANRLILVACVLNLVLPSKMGDFAKAWFMKERGHLRAEQAFALVVFEKASDLLSLLLWCAFGLLLYPEKNLLFWGMTICVTGGLVAGLLLLGSPTVAGLAFRIGHRLSPGKFRAKLAKLESAWQEMHQFCWQDKARLWLVAGTSVFIWFLHLLQIWLFTLALRTPVPFLAGLALSPLAILAGLLPLTFAGVGTRDAALIFFFRAYLDAPTGAALGILCTMRYVLPALAGLPYITSYLPGLRAARKPDSD
jgi:glycosyltransferase 2 family protein